MNVWEHFDKLLKQASSVVQGEYEMGNVTKAGWEEYVEKTRRLQKQVKGADYNADEDDKNIGY